MARGGRGATSSAGRGRGRGHRGRSHVELDREDSVEEMDADEKYSEEMKSPIRPPSNHHAEPIDADRIFHHPAQPMLEHSEETPVTMRTLLKGIKDLQWPRSGMTTTSDKLNLFLLQFEGRVRKYGGLPVHMIDLLGEVLKGPALSWYLNADRDHMEWPAFKVEMMRRFQPPRPYDVVLKQLQACKKQPTEDYNSHLERFLEITQDISGPRSQAFPLGQQISLYLSNLPVDVGDKIRDSYRTQLEVTCGMPSGDAQGKSEWPTLGEICCWATAIDLELKERAKLRQSQSTTVVSVPVTSAVGTATPSVTLPPSGSNYKGKHFDPNYQANKRQKVGHSSDTHSKPESTLGLQSPNNPTIDAATVRPLGSQDSTPGPRRYQKGCWNCGQEGHIRANCNQPPKTFPPNFKRES